MKPITLEDVARMPRPGWAIPGGLAFSPDDSLVTYLYSPEGGLVRQLYAFNPQTGQRRLLVTPPGGVQEADLSLEEKLRRERQRQLELGVTSYAWSPKLTPAHTARLLMPFPDGLYMQEVRLGEQFEPGELQKLVDSANGAVIDPRFSPDGQWIAYVQADELWVMPAAGGEPRQLTHGARENGRTHGLAEYIAQEEMARSQGYWWSPDSRCLAFEAADEAQVPTYRIMHQGQPPELHEDHHYPFSGQANAHVQLGVIAREGGEPAWMDLGAEAEIYLARVHWLPAQGDAGQPILLAEVENRAQTRLDLLRFDLATGKAERILQEQSEVWINLHNAFRPIKSGRLAGCFLWASERTGYRHLYLYSAEGRLLRGLTNGDWMVDDLVGLDEKNQLVYFTATRQSPLKSQLYRVPLEEPSGGPVSEPLRLTSAPGLHQIVFNHDCTRYLDTFNALDTPPSIQLCSSADGATVEVLYAPEDERITELQLEPPELVTLENRAGTALYGAIYRPPAQFGAGPFPTIVSVYGGPHAQLVTNSWRLTTDMRAQYLRQQGFLVFVLDNRGSARRGLAFEGAVKNHLGDLEVQDQVDGVRWLAQQGLADPARVGIYGWSYGGYMSLMCLMRAPEVFKAAVAGAPVTHWEGYDTHYTERYMGTPESNPGGYADSAVMKYVGQMQGQLMLVHGLIDENVHFRHTAHLINALIEARQRYQLLLFPDERHMPRKLADRVFMEEQIGDFFKQALS